MSKTHFGTKAPRFSVGEKSLRHRLGPVLDPRGPADHSDMRHCDSHRFTWTSISHFPPGWAKKHAFQYA